MAPLTQFHASMVDLADERHQNMDGLVLPEDFNPEIIVRFLHDNGIDAYIDQSTGGFRYMAADPARSQHVLFACICLRASISYLIEAAYWCMRAKR